MININLGFIFDAAGDLKNHRSLLKVCLNPFLRSQGWEIVSFISDSGRFEGYALQRCATIPVILGMKCSWEYELLPGDFRLAVRTIL